MTFISGPRNPPGICGRQGENFPEFLSNCIYTWAVFDKARGGDNLVSSDKRRQAARMEEEWWEVKTWKGKDNSAENGEDS